MNFSFFFEKKNIFYSLNRITGKNNLIKTRKVLYKKTFQSKVLISDVPSRFYNWEKTVATFDPANTDKPRQR